MNYRSLRFAKLIREELGMLLARELEFGGALPTITAVAVSKKLDVANVKLSVWPSEAHERVFTLLNESRGMIQRLLWKRLNVKPMPQLRFEYDAGPGNAARVEKILIEEQNK